MQETKLTSVIVKHCAIVKHKFWASGQGTAQHGSGGWKEYPSLSAAGHHSLISQVLTTVMDELFLKFKLALLSSSFSTSLLLISED